MIALIEADLAAETIREVVRFAKEEKNKQKAIVKLQRIAELKTKEWEAKKAQSVFVPFRLPFHDSTRETTPSVNY